MNEGWTREVVDYHDFGTLTDADYVEFIERVARWSEREVRNIEVRHAPRRRVVITCEMRLRYRRESLVLVEAAEFVNGLSDV